MTTRLDLLAQVQSQLPLQLHDYLHVNEYGVLFHHPFLILHSIDLLRPEIGVESLSDNLFKCQTNFTQRCDGGDWVGALLMVQRPYRAECLADLMEKHGVERLIGAISYVWGDAGYVSDDEEAACLWQHIWSQVTWTRNGKSRKRRYHVMHREDRKAFCAMPDFLTVYRGYSIPGHELGFSWTLDRAKAEWFARRYAGASVAGGAFVASMIVSKDSILAYFNGRKEEEMVIDPDSICYDAMLLDSLPAIAVDAERAAVARNKIV